MISKKYIIAMGVAATALVGVASMVAAQNDFMGMMPSAIKMRIEDMRGDGGQLPILNVGPKGEVLMRGTITAVGTDSITVKSWAGDWVVKVSAETNLQPETGIAQFKVGDFVGVQGVVSQLASLTIDARLVRNWTAKKAMAQENLENRLEKKELKLEDVKASGGVQAQINAILEQIKKIQAQISAQTAQ